MSPNHFLIKLLAATGVGLLSLAVPARSTPASPASHGAGAAGQAVDGPLHSIHAHVGGFHFYSGDRSRAVRVEHYCAQPGADVMQCVVYDSDRPDARLIGVEYIISEARFNELPAEEKQLWHSHRYEVMAGLLTAPGLSAAAEKELMKMFVNTYGKTWTLWQVDRGDQIPLGLPKLMMGYTADGQLDPALVAARDRDRKIDTGKIKAERADLPARPVAAGADGGPSGRAFQISDGQLLPVPDPRQP